MNQELIQLKPVIDSSVVRDDVTVRAKFAVWDKAVEENWLATHPARAAKLLSDPSIYAYAFFRDKDGQPVRVYSYQDAILNDTSNRVIFAAARQIGKSFMLRIKALHFALMNPGTTTILVSKTLPQAKDLLLGIKEMLYFSPLDSKSIMGEAENKTELYFRHFDTVDGEVVEMRQSRIICVPATDAARGYSSDLLLIDELAFYDDSRYFYFQVALPTTYRTRGRIVCFSNPNGQTGAFWELWNDPQFARYRFTFLDCPGNTQEMYDKEILALTREERESSLDVVFTSAAGSFLSQREREAIQEQRANMIPTVITEPLYIFFDFAKARDRTLRAIGVPVQGTDNLVGVNVHEMFEYDQGTPYDSIIADLHLLIQEVGPDNVAMIGWDNTGVGGGIEDFIKKVGELGIICTPVKFDLETKSRNYTLFKLLVERTVAGRTGIKIPFTVEGNKQLSTLVMKKSANNKLMVHHADERDRDDYPDAIVGLCSLIVQPSRIPVTISVIGNDSFSKYAEETRQKIRNGENANGN